MLPAKLVRSLLSQLAPGAHVYRDRNAFIGRLKTGYGGIREIVCNRITHCQFDETQLYRLHCRCSGSRRDTAGQCRQDSAPATTEADCKKRRRENFPFIEVALEFAACPGPKCCESS